MRSKQQKGGQGVEDRGRRKELEKEERSSKTKQWMMEKTMRRTWRTSRRGRKPMSAVEEKREAERGGTVDSRYTKDTAE